MYRVGWPLWKLAARHVPLLIKLQVMHDTDAGVLIITSLDLPGLVVEMPDNTPAAELHREIDGCIAMLIAESLKQEPKQSPVTTWPGNVLTA